MHVSVIHVSVFHSRQARHALGYNAGQQSIIVQILLAALLHVLRPIIIVRGTPVFARQIFWGRLVRIRRVVREQTIAELGLFVRIHVKLEHKNVWGMPVVQIMCANRLIVRTCTMAAAAAARLIAGDVIPAVNVSAHFVV